MGTHYKNNFLPFNLYFEDRFGNKTKVPVLWKDEKNIDVSQLPILKENSFTGIQFYTRNEKEFDPESYCSIQTNLYDTSDTQVELKYYLKKDISTKEWIYKGENDEEYPWRMGIYFLEVHYQEEKYIGGINVLPNHLSKTQVKVIHDYLNQQVRDIIYDFVYSNKAFSNEADIDTDLPNYWYYDYVRKIEERYQEFMYSLAAISKSPKDQLENCYHPSVKSGKIDQKSLRWSLSSKGMAKNSASQQINFQLNKKKITNYNSSENQWIKNILLIWKRDILTVTSYIKQDLDSSKQKLNKQNEELNDILIEKKPLLRKSDVGENVKRDIKSQIIMIKKDIKKTNGKVSILIRWIEILEQIDTKLVYYLRHSFLKEVARGKKKPFLKNNYYYRVNSIYEELKNIKENKGIKNSLSPILKPTWQIYEYFCLFKVMQVFKDLGYNLIQGIDEGVLNLYFNDRIREGTKFILENDEKVVHVWYDHYHSNSEKEAAERNEFFYTPNSKKKPDLKIDFFKKVNNKKMFHTSIVLDAKFSRLQTIYKHSYRNRTTEQLAAYYSYFCILPEAGHRPCVERVVCLYAGDGTREIEKRYESITYLRLHPDIENGELYIVGEKELINLLQNVY